LAVSKNNTKDSILISNVDDINKLNLTKTINYIQKSLKIINKKYPNCIINYTAIERLSYSSKYSKYAFFSHIYLELLYTIYIVRFYKKNLTNLDMENINSEIISLIKSYLFEIKNKSLEEIICNNYNRDIKFKSHSEENWNPESVYFKYCTINDISFYCWNNELINYLQINYKNLWNCNVSFLTWPNDIITCRFMSFEYNKKNIFETCFSISDGLKIFNKYYNLRVSYLKYINETELISTFLKMINFKDNSKMIKYLNYGIKINFYIKYTEIKIIETTNYSKYNFFLFTYLEFINYCYILRFYEMHVEWETFARETNSIIINLEIIILIQTYLPQREDIHENPININFTVYEKEYSNSDKLEEFHFKYCTINHISFCFWNNNFINFLRFNFISLENCEIKFYTKNNELDKFVRLVKFDLENNTWTSDNGGKKILSQMSNHWEKLNNKIYKKSIANIEKKYLSK